GFLLFVLVVSGGLLVYRLPDLRTPATIESFFSREAAFLFNNLILVGIAFAVFWGTVFPVLSEWVRGVKITVGPPFLHRLNAPRALSRLVGKNRRRYGGYVIHVGVVSAFVAIAASTAFRIEVTQPLKRGEEMQVGKFRLRYERITTAEDAHLSRLAAEVSVWR